MKVRNGGIKVLMWVTAQVMLIISISLLVLEEANNVAIIFLIVVVILLLMMFVGYKFWRRDD